MAPADRPAADSMHQDAPKLVHPEEPATSADMPSWESAPPPPVREYSTPAPPPPLTPEEPQWGFDEAQIETARRAAVPMSRNEKPKPPTRETVKKAAKPNRWIGA